jgi:potassium-transporting ATPase potassium-binding subunit
VGTTFAGVAFLVLLVAALAAVHVPLGDYMYRVYTSSRHWRVEKAIYRIIGVDPEVGQQWGGYARSVLVFSFVGVLLLFFLQLLQGSLPLHLHDPATAMTPWMPMGRYLPVVFVLALGGSLARQGHTTDSSGTLRTHRPQFVGLVAAVTVILCALTFLPALALGPLAEGIH